MRRALVVRVVGVGLASLLAWAALSGCRDRKPSEPGTETVPASASGPASCASNSDCPEKWICLASRCANPSSAAIYTDPSKAVTPDKVEREVEQVGQRHEQAIDEQVEAAEGAEGAR